MQEIKLRILRAFSLLFLLTLAISGPASAAGEQFPGSEPSLSATISGDSWVYPGTDVILNIVVENHGVDIEGLRSLEYASYTINPTTALGTMLDLKQGDAPVKIKTEPFMAGDIQAGETKEGQFYIYIDENAPKGIYNLILYADYNYVFASTLIEPGRWNYIYQSKTEKIEIPVEIRGIVKPEIISVTTRDLSPGEKGEITVVIKNSGYGAGYSAAAEISGKSVLIRSVDGSVFLGDFLPGETKEVAFSADVNENAGDGMYPESLVISYTDSYGKLRESVSENFGIKVFKGARFRIVSEEIQMTPGEEKEIAVLFSNYGDEIAYDAKARIIPDSPLDASADTASLGDIVPGGNATAHFKVSMDSDALIIPYAINTEIKYRDGDDRLILSDQMKLPVYAEEGNILKNIITNPVAIAVLTGAVILIFYYIRRKKDKTNAP